MPRLSLYKPEKGNDFKFMDKTIYEQFQVGGVDVLVHKYIGPVDPTDPNKAMGELTIQDVLFLENRDRKYDTDIYMMRGVYNVQDIDFNLSQFGLFLQNDTIFMTVHINNSVETLGRKIMTGDVFELPHLKEYFALSDASYALRKFYVVEDVTRAAEGFSVTWYPHLYRLKLKPMPNSSEFKDILNKPVDETNFAGEYDPTKTYYSGQIIRYNGNLYEVTAETVGNEPPNPTYFRQLDSSEIQLTEQSDYEKVLGINQAIVAEAEADSALSGFETSQFWTLSVDTNSGNVNLQTVDATDIAIDDANTTDAQIVPPVKDGYMGYLLGDGIAPNGAPYGFGIKFPDNAAVGDFFLRTDYYPNRLFRFSGKRWVKYEDKVRHTLTNNDVRKTQKTSFINNNELSGIGMLETDVFTIKDPMTFRPTDPTNYIDIVGKKIVTKVPYVQTYGVESWLGEGRNDVTSMFEEDGYIAFTVRYMEVGRELRWTVYKETVKQKQALSKALRPRADF